MDDLNNLDPNNNQNPNNSTQGPNPYPDSNFDPNTGTNSGFDPNSGTNSGFDPNSGTNSGFDPNAGINSNIGFDASQSSDPYASLNPTPFNPNMDSNNGNVNDFDNQSTINPILSQNIANDNSNTSYDQNNSTVPNMNYQDNNINSNMGYDQNNFTDPNMNYQDNNINSNMGYDQNNFTDPNMNYQDNNINSNMGYDQNGFTDPNMNYQDNNINSNMGYDQNNFTDPNTSYQDNNFNTNMNSGSNDYNTDFVKNWMGSLYEKAHSSKFSWPAALFGGIYFLYRKMYLTGILFTLLNLLIYSVLLFLFSKIGMTSLALMSLTGIIFIFVYGFSFYPLYKNFVQKKLKKYKQTITDNSQLLNIATTKGNTSVVAVIVYCVVTPIIAAIVALLLMSAGLFSLGKDIINDALNNYNTNETLQAQDEVDTDILLFNFTDDYILEYDSLVWFLDEETKTLTKGDYSLLFAQAIPNVTSSFGSDITSPSGRSTLLGTLLTTLESQAATLNLSVESGVSNFVMQANAFYGYIDVTSAESISRYYFILLPDDDVLFQFVLTINDTTVDYETNLDAINILTSVYKDENGEASEDTNTTADTNTVDENITNENTENVVDEENTNSVSTNVTNRNMTSDNSISNGVSVSENVSNVSSNLSDVLD